MLMLGTAAVAGLLALLTGDPALGVIEGQPHTSARALTDHHVRAVVAISAVGVATLVGLMALFLARNHAGAYSRRMLWGSWPPRWHQQLH